MRIPTLFLVCMSAVAALATCLGTWTLTQMVAEYSLAGRVQRAADIDVLLFVAMDKIAVERPLVGNALLAELPANAAFDAKLRDIRRNADDALATIERAMSRDAYPGSVAQRAVIAKARADLAAWRSTVDAALSVPKTERDQNIFLHVIANLNLLFESITRALDIGDMAAALQDGTTVQLINLSRLVWQVRMTAGNRNLPLMAAIENGVGLGHDELEVQAGFNGRLAADWSSIRAFSRSLSSMPDVATALTRGQAAFDGYETLVSSVVTAGKAGADYPVTALVLGYAVVSTAPVLLELRDVALAAVQARVAAQLQVALLDVIIAAAVLALTVVAMAIVLMVLQRRIVSPVLALTEVIGRIARLDFDLRVPARQRSDEIGHMAAAIETLRLGAIAAEANKAYIVRLARHDALTGLPNRLMLEERLEQAVSMAGRGHTSALLLPRPGPLQGGQRHLWPSHRRPAAASGR